MPREPDPLVLELLHRIDAKLDQARADLSEINACLDRCIERLDAMGRGGLFRAEDALGRIEHRLGLIDERLGVVGDRPAHWQRGL